jgi:4'-phosphopantetheinyl transferase
MEVHWLEQTESDVPAGNDWLSVSEQARLDGLRFPKRRADWRLGRWTAKRAVAAYLNMPAFDEDMAKIEIRAAPSGAPDLAIANSPARLAISLSHSAGVAFCGVAPFGTALGCDVEMMEPRSESFITDYFTLQEQALIARASPGDRSRIVTLLWSGKESAFKALRVGLRLDTRCAVVIPLGRIRNPVLTWYPLLVRVVDGQTFNGWWRQAGDLIRTVVAAPRALSPLKIETDGQA